MTPVGQASVIGIVSDGKAGHRNQSLGLADALQRLRPDLEVREFPPMAPLKALWAYLRPTQPAESAAVFIGAGHGTHLTLLAMARAARCPAVVLMRPSLPGTLFDLRIEPRHDGGRETQNCWLSDGPLNRVVPADSRSAGLILVGGPSPHFQWDDEILLAQLTRICDGSQQWVLSTSRRTPADFAKKVSALGLPGLEVHEVDELPMGWLSSVLPAAEFCWVTPDSASMVYEALTAGCAVGLHDLQPEQGSRVAGAMADLADRGLVTGFSAFAAGRALSPSQDPLAEADRCAKRLVDEGWIAS